MTDAPDTAAEIRGGFQQVTPLDVAPPELVAITDSDGVLLSEASGLMVRLLSHEP